MTTSAGTSGKVGSSSTRGIKKGTPGSSLFVKDKSGKFLTGKYRWGKRGVFKKYLDSLTSAAPFLGERGVMALANMGPARRHLIMKRLHLVDPEGFRKIQTNNRKYHAAKRTAKTKKLEQLQKVAVADGLVAMAQEAFDKEGITLFRFVPADGILATIAYLLAVGHSKLEVSEKLKLDPEIIKRVTPEMIAEQKKNIGMETIIKGANQKVAFDLVSGNVTKETAIADKIATGRMKLMLDASDKGRRRGLLPSEIKDKTESHADRFGAAKQIPPEDVEA